jgi:ABC-2 type transport system permease protein
MGMLISSFIASWVFGREFMDKTNKDLIAKPISRATVMLSKFIIIFLWDIVFMIFLFFFLLFIGLFLGLTGFSSSLAMGAFQKFVVTFLLYIVISTPGALFSSISKGILAPIGILFIQVIAANMLSNTGAAPYFPWTIPPKFYMNSVSIVILIATGVAGLAGTLAWWRFAEQK